MKGAGDGSWGPWCWEPFLAVDRFLQRMYGVGRGRRAGNGGGENPAAWLTSSQNAFDTEFSKQGYIHVAPKHGSYHFWF